VCEIERPSALIGEHALSFGRMLTEVDGPYVNPHVVDSYAPGLALLSRKYGSQHAVPPNLRVEALLERADVEAADDPKRSGHVVC
jgi:hypothetical protein